VVINGKSGEIRIKMHDLMKPFVLQLKKKFTQYELVFTLAMKSRYSIRLYEILKSYSNLYRIDFDLNVLKKMLSAEHYERFPDFKRKVLETALKEINELSDVTVTYEIGKEGRRFAAINFYINVKADIEGRMSAYASVYSLLDEKERAGSKL
jgi:plasmid replication initiation protein